MLKIKEPSNHGITVLFGLEGTIDSCPVQFPINEQGHNRLDQVVQGY